MVGVFVQESLEKAGKEPPRTSPWLPFIPLAHEVFPPLRKPLFESKGGIRSAVVMLLFHSPGTRSPPPHQPSLAIPQKTKPRAGESLRAVAQGGLPGPPTCRQPSRGAPHPPTRGSRLPSAQPPAPRLAQLPHSRSRLEVRAGDGNVTLARAIGRAALSSSG